MTFDIHRHVRTVNRLLRVNTPFVTVTMVGIRGSAPQIVGAKAVITNDGIVDGTVGGGKVEAAAN